MRNAFYCLLLLNVTSYSAIRHYQDTLWLSSYITYQSENAIKDSIDSYNENVLKCYIDFSGDLFFYPEKVFTCICFIDTFAIGSSKPFYVSKKSVDSVDFSSNLNLNSEDIYYKIDTMYNDPREPATCVRPHIHTGKIDSTYYPKFLIINTKSGYVLVTYRDLWCTFVDITLGTIRFYNKILVDSYLQDDNSLNFSDISDLLKTNSKQNYTINIRKDNFIFVKKYYDLKGREISNKNLQNGLFIFNNNPLIVMKLKNSINVLNRTGGSLKKCLDIGRQSH